MERVLVVDDDAGLCQLVTRFLAREGFDPAQISEPLYLREPQSGAYAPLDAKTYASITDGTIRL